MKNRNLSVSDLVRIGAYTLSFYEVKGTLALVGVNNQQPTKSSSMQFLWDWMFQCRPLFNITFILSTYGR
jgi:hypothetical protein